MIFSVLNSVFVLLLDCNRSDLPEAETECERLLQGSLAACAQNAQTFISLCSLRLIQQRPQEARAALQQALALLDAGAAENMDTDEEIASSFELRLEAAKMCLECAMYEQCTAYAERLLAFNDTELQLWYLAGMAYARQEPPLAAEAVEYLGRTLQELDTTGEDPPLADEVREVLAAMQQRLALEPSAAAAGAADGDDEAAAEMED